MYIELEKRTLTAEMAESCGFDHVGYCDPEKMEFMSEIHDMCAANKCGNYNKKWACPPACGSLEEISAKVKSYDYGMILQCTEQMEDDYDWDAIQKANVRCGDALQTLAKKLRTMGYNILAMGTNGCSKCTSCTYPDAPCRFPEELAPSMEACGFFVSHECEKAGMKYTYGPQTMTYNATIFIKEK